MRLPATLVAVLALTVTPTSGVSQQVAFEERFDGGLGKWERVRLDRRPTEFATTTSGNERVLVATTRNSAAALLHRLDMVDPTRAVLEWRWRVSSALTDNDRERERRGDDYVARVFVMFGDDPFKRGTRALCYVWAGQEEVGARYPSPVIDDVATVVVRSGDVYAGRWMREQRDLITDFETAFGERPGEITGIAVMADTDDTGGQSISWFDDISLRIEAPPH